MVLSIPLLDLAPYRVQFEDFPGSRECKKSAIENLYFAFYMNGFLKSLPTLIRW